MPYNLLILPLIGGYLFLLLFRIPRYLLAAYTGQQLLLNSVVAGTLFLLLTFATDLVLRVVNPTWYQEAVILWKSVVDIEHSGKSVGALLLGPFLALFGNLVLTRSFCRKIAIKWRKNAIENFLIHYITARKRVMCELRNGKVYIGTVVSLAFGKKPVDAIGLLVVKSGHRNSQNGLLSVDLDYVPALRELTGQLRKERQDIRRNFKETANKVFSYSFLETIKEMANNKQASVIRPGQINPFYRLVQLRKQEQEIDQKLTAISDSVMLIPISEIVVIRGHEESLYAQFNPRLISQSTL